MPEASKINQKKNKNRKEVNLNYLGIGLHC